MKRNHGTKTFRWFASFLELALLVCGVTSCLAEDPGGGSQGELHAALGIGGGPGPGEISQPLVLCRESLFNEDGSYDCTFGRMLNSGQDTTTHGTAAWTDFEQEDACRGGTNTQAVKSRVCSDGNSVALSYGYPVTLLGGAAEPPFDDLRDCWRYETSRASLWPQTLLVIACPGNNVGTCGQVVGAVSVDIVWITGPGEDPDYADVPRIMYEHPGPDSQLLWSCDHPDGRACWESFVAHFNLQNPDGAPAAYQKKTVYFLPDCAVAQPVGG